MLRVYLHRLHHSAVSDQLEQFERDASALAHELRRLREEMQGMEFVEMSARLNRVQQLQEFLKHHYSMLFWYLRHIEFRKENH